MANARYIIGDVFDALATLEDNSVDLVFSSPPFLALRSYLPADHEFKSKEIGSEATPADFLDTLLDVVEACDRVLAPHGSLCFELGDTYAGSGGAGGDYAEGGLREGQNGFDGAARRERARTRDSRPGREHTATAFTPRPEQAGGNGWPLPKSLSGIPTLFAWSLAYGRNLLRPERTTPRWRIRNVVVWARPNPPVGALGDKFRPATSYLTVACKSDKRWFDLDAVRTEYKGGPGGGKGASTNASTQDDWHVAGGHRFPEAKFTHEAGAPPLDYWEIPTQPSNGEGTSRRLRVPLDGLVGGIQRTTSADCPEHGSSGRQDSSAERGEREAAGSIRTPGTDGRPARAQQAEPPPTFWSTDQTVGVGSLAVPAATPHSSASSRTAPDPGTTPAGTPSARTAAHTERTSVSPESSDSESSTDESRTADEADSVADLPRTGHHTDHSSPSSACTCSHFVDLDVAEPTTNYAPIPGRKTGGKYAGRSNASREPGTGDRGGSAFETHEGGAPPLDYWEIPTQGYAGSHYATFPDKLVVKPVKAMCPSKVCRVCGEPSRRIVEHTRTMGEPVYGSGRGLSQGGPFSPDYEVTRETLGWSDCGHNDYRAGAVLDPFAGSGTTLAVATGHGRDAIGVDIDSRNAELALERVGPLFLSVEHLSTELAT